MLMTSDISAVQFVWKESLMLFLCYASSMDIMISIKVHRVCAPNWLLYSISHSVTISIVYIEMIENYVPLFRPELKNMQFFPKCF